MTCIFRSAMCVCVSVSVSCRRSVQLSHPTSLSRNLATSVVPEHSLCLMVCQYVGALALFGSGFFLLFKGPGGL